MSSWVLFTAFHPQAKSWEAALLMSWSRIFEEVEMGKTAVQLCSYFCANYNTDNIFQKPPQCEVRGKASDSGLQKGERQGPKQLVFSRLLGWRWKILFPAPSCAAGEPGRGRQAPGSWGWRSTQLTRAPATLVRASWKAQHGSRAGHTYWGGGETDAPLQNPNNRAGI